MVESMLLMLYKLGRLQVSYIFEDSTCHFHSGRRRLGETSAPHNGNVMMFHSLVLALRPPTRNRNLMPAEPVPGFRSAIENWT